MNKCIFKDCVHTVHPGSTKCLFHRNRSKCEEPNCPNQAYARNRCVRHGAKKVCVVEGCQQNRRIGTYCSKHADANQKKRCKFEGCDKLPHARGLCVRHGGGRICKSPGCTSHARIGLLCARHFHGLESPTSSPRTVAEVPVLPSYNIPTTTNIPASMGTPDGLDLAILADLVQDDKDDNASFWAELLDTLLEPKKCTNESYMDPSLFFVMM